MEIDFEKIAIVVGMVVHAITIYIAVLRSKPEMSKLKAETAETAVDFTAKLQPLLAMTIEQGERMFKLHSQVIHLRHDITVAKGEIDDLKRTNGIVMSQRDAEHQAREIAELERDSERDKRTSLEAAHLQLSTEVFALRETNRQMQAYFNELVQQGVIKLPAKKGKTDELRNPKLPKRLPPRSR